MKPTMVIGMSCSAMSSDLRLALRLRWAARAEVTPPISGPRSLSSVQMAATPMAPAPMKRTWLRQTSMAAASASPGVRLHAGHQRHGDDPGDQEAGEHGDADGEADEVAGAEKGELHAEADAGCAAAEGGGKAEEGCGLADEDARGDEPGSRRPRRWTTR